MHVQCTDDLPILCVIFRVGLNPEWVAEVVAGYIPHSEWG